jgi:hypothetical protein
LTVSEPVWNLIVLVVGFLLSMWLAGAITFGVVRQLGRQRAGLGECVSVGLGRMFPVLGTAILAALCMIGAVLPGFLVILASRGEARFLGRLLIYVPGLIVYLMLAAAVPVSVIERPGVFGAIKRSARLTSGRKFPIFLVFLAIGIIQFLARLAMVAAVRPASRREIVFDDEGELVEALEPGEQTTFLLTSLGLEVLIGTLTAVAIAVIYHDLRVSKEGASVEDLAKVFD